MVGLFLHRDPPSAAIKLDVFPFELYHGCTYFYDGTFTTSSGVLPPHCPSKVVAVPPPEVAAAQAQQEHQVTEVAVAPAVTQSVKLSRKLVWTFRDGGSSVACWSVFIIYLFFYTAKTNKTENKHLEGSYFCTHTWTHHSFQDCWYSLLNCPVYCRVHFSPGCQYLREVLSFICSLQVVLLRKSNLLDIIVGSDSTSLSFIIRSMTAAHCYVVTLVLAGRNRQSSVLFYKDRWLVSCEECCVFKLCTATCDILG